MPYKMPTASTATVKIKDLNKYSKKSDKISGVTNLARSGIQFRSSSKTA